MLRAGLGWIAFKDLPDALTLARLVLVVVAGVGSA